MILHSIKEKKDVFGPLFPWEKVFPEFFRRPFAGVWRLGWRLGAKLPTSRRAGSDVRRAVYFIGLFAKVIGYQVNRWTLFIDMHSFLPITPTPFEEYYKKIPCPYRYLKSNIRFPNLHPICCRNPCCKKHGRLKCVHKLLFETFTQVMQILCVIRWLTWIESQNNMIIDNH